jgi:hypothetical protein
MISIDLIEWKKKQSSGLPERPSDVGKVPFVSPITPCLSALVWRNMGLPVLRNLAG